MPEPEKTTAVVLRVVDFSESSSVVTLFTSDFGKISGLAKGGRKPKGSFESALDLLSLVRVVFLRKSSGTLDLLTEAKLERRFRPGANELTRLYSGYYVAELLNELTHDHDPHPELFELAERTLWELSRAAEEPAAIVLRFELGLLRETGHLPALTSCAECGADLLVTPRVTFGILDGGGLCAKCRVGKRQLVSVRREVLQTLQEFAERGSEQPPVVLPRERLGELRGLLNHYLVNLLGTRPRLHDFLQHVTH